jgi:GNAT superfamily N-acetyltransferase
VTLPTEGSPPKSGVADHSAATAASEPVLAIGAAGAAPAVFASRCGSMRQLAQHGSWGPQDAVIGIHYVGVDFEFRRQGLGSQLVSLVEGMGEAAGYVLEGRLGYRIGFKCTIACSVAQGGIPHIHNARCNSMVEYWPDQRLIGPARHGMTNRNYRRFFSVSLGSIFRMLVLYCAKFAVHSMTI